MSTTIHGPGEAATATDGEEAELDVQAGGRNGDGPDDGGRKVQVDDNPDPEKPGEMFAGSAFELDKVYIDDQAADGLVIAFGGSVKLADSDNPATEEDVAFFNDLALGKSVELSLWVPGRDPIRISGRIAAKSGAYKENAEGESTVTGKATVKVNSLQF